MKIIIILVVLLGLTKGILTKMILAQNQSDISCPSVCTCFEAKEKAICSTYVGIKIKQIDYIPRLPSYITWLKFVFNKLPEISTESLFNLTFLTIKTLVIQGNKVTNISYDAFRDIQRLQRLEINDNPSVSMQMLPDAFRSLNKSVISFLGLKNNHWKDLPVTLFSQLQGSQLSSVSLEGNRIQNVNARIFSGLKNLREISFLSNKVLESFDLNGMPISVRSLDMSDNNFHKFPKFCVGNRSLLPSLVSLKMNKNQIGFISSSTLKCLVNLKDIHLNANRIKRFRRNVFKYLTSLHDLGLNQQQHVSNIEESAFDVPSLTKLGFAGNNFRFRHPNHFKNCLNLTYLNIAHNYLTMTSPMVKEMFVRFKKIRKLHLQDVGLRILPLDLFSNMPSLEMLNLASNKIVGWNDNPRVFGNITWLKALNLEANQITLINKTSFPAGMLAKLSEIKLAGNRFACTCDIMWFRDWIRNRGTVHLVNWPMGYICRSPLSMTGKRLENFNPTKESCKKPNPLIKVVIILSVIGVTLVFIISIVYKSRWHIRYWIYLLRAKRTGYETIKGNADFVYDGFVVYCEEDREWVHETMIKKIEEEDGYRLCIHYRDFDIGKLIVDNIIECMDQSRKIIVVLSNASASSEWCQFELRVSHDRFLNEHTNELVLIMLEEINNRNLSGSLKAIITTTTYAVWTSDAIGQIQFWDQLEKALVY